MRSLVSLCCIAISAALLGCSSAPPVSDTPMTKAQIIAGPNGARFPEPNNFLGHADQFDDYIDSLGLPSLAYYATGSRIGSRNQQTAHSSLNISVQQPSYSQDRERLKRVIDSIFEEDGLGFVYNPTANHTAPESLSMAEGNCISFSGMVVQLLRQAGFNARFQLVNSSPVYSYASTNTFRVNQHANVKVFLSPTDTITLDINTGVERFTFGSRVISDEEAAAEFYNNLGAEAMIANHYDEAHQHFTTALHIFDASSGSWSNLGLLYNRMGYPEYAEAAFRKGALTEYNNEIALSNLERLLRAQNRIEEADELLSYVQVYRNKNPFIHQQRANDALVKGELEMAIAHLNEALELAPEIASTNQLLGLTHRALGHTRLANRYLARARELTRERDLPNYNRKAAAFSALMRFTHAQDSTAG